MSANRKILIVEDEMPLQKVLAEKFEREGFAVLTAKDGEEGLASALKNEPDMILLDIIMPKIDGLTMLKELRKTAYGKSANIIILSNLSDSTAVVKSMESGVSDFLVKTDWRLEDVVKKVKHTLNVA